jgi:glycosyltransferase involved in cell wall biosynthesis
MPFWKSRIKGVSRKNYLKIQKDLEDQNFALVFVNSVANAGLYEEFLTFLHHIPLVVFAHELKMSVEIYTKESHLKFLLDKSSHLITVSNAVSDYYLEHFNYPKSRSSTFTLINSKEILEKIKITDSDYLERNFNIPSDAIVVGGCGNAEWRKGNDIFNLIARQVIEKLAGIPIYFVWVGAGSKQPFYELIRFDIEQFALTDRIILIPPTPNALDIMTRFDIFLLTSREDPYPLVVLEAALLQKPIVCFKNAGGAPELVEEDAGTIVDYLDISQASNAIVELIVNPADCKRKGLRAKQKVLERHNTEKSIQKFLSIIEDNMARPLLEINS